MIKEDIDISTDDYVIKASIKIPKYTRSRNGIILSHGSIINRQSLLRNENSFADYLSAKLDAHVIAPDVLGETRHLNGQLFSNFSEIINLTSDYFIDKYDLDSLVGFGHSMGSYVLAQAVQSNPNIDAIANYGGPILELSKGSGFIKYLANYLTSYKYNLNTKNILKYIFDEETCRYLLDVMLVEEEYKGDNYLFEFESSLYLDIMNVITGYLDLIKNWGKPALLLFGSEDKVTKTTFKHFSDNEIDENVQFKYLSRASHVTPCMRSHSQLSKLEPVALFFSEIFGENISKMNALRGYNYGLSGFFNDLGDSVPSEQLLI
jgi:pimeloyl-ACP methyl ester carboxylesterase